MVVLLSIISASLIHGIRRSQERAALELDTLSSQLLADGAINRAIISFLDAKDGSHWHIDGARQDVILDGHAVGVSVMSEAGKIDLNAASATTLAGILMASGASTSESAAIADRIIAWRSHLDFGVVESTSESYVNAGRRYVPRHGAFRSVGELRLILGMTDNIQAAVAPMLTVYTGSPNIDISVASDGVLRALAATGNSFAAMQMRARSVGNAAGGNRHPVIGEPLMIEAKVMKGLGIADRVAVVCLTADSRQGYQVLSWR
jgi:general secretion pathway protein K